MPTTLLTGCESDSCGEWHRSHTPIFFSATPAISSRKFLATWRITPSECSSRYWTAVARGLTAVLLFATLFLVQPVIALSAAIVLGGFYVIIFRLLARKRREVDENLRTASRRLIPGSASDARRD